MALTDSDLSELLAALKAGEMTDTIRTSLEWILQQLIEAEATAVIGAGPHERSETRTTQRNGHRPKLVSTAAGDVELAIPKLRRGSFFPSLLERRRRIDRPLDGVPPPLRGARQRNPRQPAQLPLAPLSGRRFSAGWLGEDEIEDDRRQDEDDDPRERQELEGAPLGRRRQVRLAQAEIDAVRPRAIEDLANNAFLDPLQTFR